MPPKRKVGSLRTYQKRSFALAESHPTRPEMLYRKDVLRKSLKKGQRIIHMLERGVYYIYVEVLKEEKNDRSKSKIKQGSGGDLTQV